MSNGRGDAVSGGSYCVPVAFHQNDLRGEALALPESARAELAAELLVSLEHEPDEDLGSVNAQWANEIENRARRALAGDVTSQDWIAVRQRLSDALTE